MSGNCTEFLSVVLHPWRKPTTGTQNMKLPYQWHIPPCRVCKMPNEHVPEPQVNR